MKARILVIRFSSIGDIVLTSALLRRLHAQFDGGVEIHFLTKKSFAFLVENNPHVECVHAIERATVEVIEDLRVLQFDYIIDLHNNFRSAMVKRSLQLVSFTFRKCNLAKWLWVNFGINRMPKNHVVDRYMETLRVFEIKDDDQGLDYFFPSDFVPPALPNTPYLAVVNGGAHEGKRMDADHWISALEGFTSGTIVLLGGKGEDEQSGKRIAEALGDRVWQLTGKLNVHESAWFLKYAQVVVTGDTGMMHIASAFNKKIISLWGCTVPGLGMSPYRPHPESIILEPFGRKKRPCSKLGNRCKYGMDNRCVHQIQPTAIQMAIEKLWAP